MNRPAVANAAKEISISRLECATPGMVPSGPSTLRDFARYRPAARDRWPSFQYEHIGDRFIEPLHRLGLRSARTYPPSRQGQQQMVAPPSLWHTPFSGSLQVWMRRVWSYRQPCRTMHRLYCAEVGTPFRLGPTC